MPSSIFPVPTKKEEEEEEEDEEEEAEEQQVRGTGNCSSIGLTPF